LRIRFLMHNVYGHGGGVLTVTFNLARDLAERGHDVEVVSAFRDRTQPVVPAPEGVRVRTLADLRPQARGRGPLGRLEAWAMNRPSRLHHNDTRRHRHSLYTDFHLLRYLRTARADAIVGMQPGISLAIARFGRRRRGCVRVVQEHRPFRERSQALRADYARYGSRLDAFLTLTERDARHARKQLDGVRVLAMPNGTPEYAGEPSDHENKVVVAAGRLKRSKGFDLLVAAWARVAERHPEWRLRIFGDGPLRADLQAQIDDLGLQESVHLMGYTTRMQQEMARSSLFVLSSRREGYGMVLVEAMSCGVPGVSFDCPTGPRDIIGDGRGGVLVANGDVDGLADAVVAMIEAGPERRRELGKAARARAHEHSRPVIAQRWERLLSGRPVP
jgi:glycosyltransferase involved in cell wall biosynthesis